MKLEIKEQLSNHMKLFGIHMLAKGLVTATFNEDGNPYGHSMSVVQVAHGAELVIKARIAEEHPLLIFTNLPKSVNSIDTLLGIEDLLNKGKTIMYSELPERLWSTTGNKISNFELFNQFGDVRNQIVHMGVPNIDLSDLTLQFGYGIIEPLINEWWDETILNYTIEYDDAYLEYVFEQTERLNIKLNYRLTEEYKLEKK